VKEALIPCMSTCYWCSRKSWISCNISLLALLLVSGIYICAWHMTPVSFLGECHSVRGMSMIAV
jgi:hypothetical protein